MDLPAPIQGQRPKARQSFRAESRNLLRRGPVTPSRLHQVGYLVDGWVHQDDEGRGGPWARCWTDLSDAQAIDSLGDCPPINTEERRLCPLCYPMGLGVDW